MNETDVLVLGTGNAALVAALAAHEQGAKVTILERAPQERRGGNSAFSGGIFRFAFREFDEIRPFLTESPTLPFTKAEVEPYGPDAFHNDLMRVTEGLADPNLSQFLVENSLPTVSWMASQGVTWELHPTHAAERGGKFIWRSGTVPVEARGGGREIGRASC